MENKKIVKTMEEFCSSLENGKDEAVFQEIWINSELLKREKSKFAEFPNAIAENYCKALLMPDDYQKMKESEKLYFKDFEYLLTEDYRNFVNKILEQLFQGKQVSTDPEVLLLKRYHELMLLRFDVINKPEAPKEPIINPLLADKILEKYAKHFSKHDIATWKSRFYLYDSPLQPIEVETDLLECNNKVILFGILKAIQDNVTKGKFDFNSMVKNNFGFEFKKAYSEQTGKKNITQTGESLERIKREVTAIIKEFHKNNQLI